jgi:hypothetical protein
MQDIFQLAATTLFLVGSLSLKGLKYDGKGQEINAVNWSTQKTKTMNSLDTNYKRQNKKKPRG